VRIAFALEQPPQTHRIVKVDEIELSPVAKRNPQPLGCPLRELRNRSDLPAANREQLVARCGQDQGPPVGADEHPDLGSLPARSKSPAGRRPPRDGLITPDASHRGLHARTHVTSDLRGFARRSRQRHRERRRTEVKKRSPGRDRAL